MEKLVERLRKETYWSGSSGPGSREIHPLICDEAATAITDLLARAEKAEKERDVAVDYLRQMCVGGNTCAFCKHGRNCGKQGPGRKSVEHCWEWCGQKEE